MATIPACPAAMPKVSRLGVSAINSDSPISNWLSFTRFEPNTSQELLELGDDTNTGSLSSYESQAVLNKITVAPSFNSHPTAGEWRQVLPWGFDGTESGAGTAGSPYAYPLASLLTRRYVFWDDTIGVWNIKEVAVDELSITASTNDPALKVSLGLVGTNYDKTGTFPAGLTPDNTAPFIFSDMVVTVGGTPILCEGITLSVSKNVAKDRFFNSTTIACAVSQSRKVSITLQGYPWGPHAALFTSGLVTSVPVVLTFTRGLSVLKFTMPRCRQNQKAPGADVPNEIKNDWMGRALASTSNDELAATLSLT